MTTQRASERILTRLKDEAQVLARPATRLASIERLVMACDAIESGAAADTDTRVRANAPINPSNIEKYVKAKFRNGARDWSGPTRVFIAQDPDLRAYVAAREDERAKPVDLRKRPSQRQKDIEDTLARFPIEIRQIVRHDLEEGRFARKRLDLLSRGLRSLPGIDVDALLRGEAEKFQGQAAAPAPIQIAAALMTPLTPRNTNMLKALVERLTNAEEMKRAGLEVDGGRLRLATAPRTTLVRPDEMALLRHLAGMDV